MSNGKRKAGDLQEQQHKQPEETSGQACMLQTTSEVEEQKQHKARPRQQVGNKLGVANDEAGQHPTGGQVNSYEQEVGLRALAPGCSDKPVDVDVATSLANLLPKQTFTGFGASLKVSILLECSSDPLLPF